MPNHPWPQLAARWREVEELGFDTLWIADHLASAFQPDRPWFEGWTMLAAMAAETERIRIGTLVASITLRRPALMAKQAVTVDHLSGGRLELGIGAAGSVLDHQLLGEQPWPPAERTARFREYVQALDLLLRGQAGFAGAHYAIEALALEPRPLQTPRPPLTIAAWSPRNIRLAAEFGDSWNTMGDRGLDPAGGRAAVRAQSELLDRACEELGRERDSIRRSLLLAKPWIAERPFASERAFREYVAAYRDAAGIDEFLFYYPPEPFLPEGSVTPGVFEHVARAVIPELRGT